MKTINLTTQEFEALDKLILPQIVYNGEGSLHFYKEITPDGEALKVFKRFRITRGPIFGNKLKTINSLIDINDHSDMQEFILPDKVVTVNNHAVGYIMPYVESTNLRVLLTDPNIDYNTKIAYLKEVGTILRKMQKMRENGEVIDFYLNDMHEGNFIVDSKTGRLKVVDLDSAKIDCNMPFLSKYLSPLTEIKHFPNKYRKTTDMICLGDFIPDENSDLYCYILMILNTISGVEICRLKQEQYFSYLEYLRDLGISDKLLEAFARIYSDEKNINPDEHLDELPEVMDKTSYKNFVMQPINRI